MVHCFDASLGLFKGRASIDGATVTLHGVNQRDSGIYHCEVTARQDEIRLGEIAVSLTVLGGLIFFLTFNSILTNYYDELNIL